MGKAAESERAHRDSGPAPARAARSTEAGRAPGPSAAVRAAGVDGHCDGVRLPA